jgi:hypothetical protein
MKPELVLAVNVKSIAAHLFFCIAPYVRVNETGGVSVTVQQ